MTRYAPTLLVGLGGSGVKVLRWIRDRQMRAMSVKSDLLVYRGLDFDLDANSGSRMTRLDDGEFFYYSPSAIADCVGNLRAEVRASGDRPARQPFREIAAWFPDPEGQFIRYAQAEAVGARQWRSLGRIGFFLNDIEIVQSLRTGLAELDARCGTKGETRPSAVCIVTSVAGGTGSGMLFDIAANLRRLRPEIGIRVVLLLPEFFEHVDFTSKVLANAYATLLEVAHFKNQYEPFTVRYPRLPLIDERMQNALFQQVYLVGPYIGDRRPFVEPEQAYAHVADLLHVFLTKELRSNAGSYQVNDDADQNADAGALADEPGAQQVFCGFSATAIPLLSYDDLATRWAATFVEEWRGTAERKDIFAAVQPPPTPETIRRLADYVDASAAQSEALKYLSAETFAKLLDDFIASYKPRSGTWSRESLQDFTRELGELTGAGATTTPRFLQEPVDRFRAAFSDKVEDLVRVHELTPFAVTTELRALADRIRRSCDTAGTLVHEHLIKFHEWLGSNIDGFLAQPLLPARMRRLKEWLEEWQEEHGRDVCVGWFSFGIRSAAVQELDKSIAKLDGSWSGGVDFVDALDRATSEVLQRDARRRERLEIGFLLAHPASEILRIEMGRFDRKQERMQMLAVSMLAVVRERIAEGHKTRDFHAAAARLLVDLKQVFVLELQPGSRTTSGVKQRFLYLSPESTYPDDVIRRAVLSATTRLFRPGRVDNILRKRTGRLLVPQSFADSEAVAERLIHLCDGLLGASMREVTPNGAEENRILILVEDLFHSAEELAGIYDYYNDYSRRNRALFHIRGDIPARFAELITTLDSPGPRHCGNPGCLFDVKGTPRTDVLCPGCARPIRNRCGNRCRLDNFTEREDRETFIARGSCPSCNRPLRTYWWHCPRHGRMAMDAPECTSCLTERRPVPSKRPENSAVYTCPACVRQGIVPPFRASGALASVLRDGAASDDGGESSRIVEKALVGGRHCPQCGAALAPLCPAEGPAHVASRATGRWVCSSHASTTLYECAECGFALAPDEYSCRRCQSLLSDCRFCTPARRLRTKAVSDRSCTRCRLPQRHPFGGVRADDEDSAALFCSNLYGCPVGADLFFSVYHAGSTSICLICSDRELALLEVRTRTMHVNSCQFCRALFARRHGIQSRSVSTPSQGACCLCGQMFMVTATLAAAPKSFDVALKIANALLESQDDAIAYGALFDSLPPSERQRMPSHIRDYARRLVRRAVRRVVGPRLERILAQHERYFGCQIQAPCPTPQSVDDDPAGDHAEAASAEESVADVLSSDRVSRLETNADFERWVAVVVRLGIDYDSFEAALGTSTNDPADPARERRLEQLREHARLLYFEMNDAK